MQVPPVEGHKGLPVGEAEEVAVEVDVVVAVAVAVAESVACASTEFKQHKKVRMKKWVAVILSLSISFQPSLAI